MKKRIISLLLCLSLVIGIGVPAMTPDADAFIGKLILTGVKMSASIIKSCVNVCKNQDDYNGNVGKAVGALFKGAAEDFLGTSFGGDSSGSDPEDKPAGTGQTVVIQQVDLSQVEASLSAINTTLEKQQQAIYQLEDTVARGIQDLSTQLDEINAKIDKLGTQVEESTKLLQYSTYLDTFFDFFNQYYEALSYYDEQVNAMLRDDNCTEEYQKNLFDRFYQLQDVEYSGTFHSAVDKLGRYLQGNYINSSPGSLVDVLSQYYITSYTLLGEKDPKVKAASATEDIIGYLFYAYVMGTYYEQAIAMYQTAVITENGGNYRTDFGTLLSQATIDATIEKLWGTTQSTVGCILRDLISNYPTAASMPVVYQLSTGEVINRAVPSALLNASGSTDAVFHVEGGTTFWLQDPVAALSNFEEAGSGYFSKEFCQAFTGIAPYQPTEFIEALNNYCLHVEDASSGNEQVLAAMLGNTPVYSVTVKLLTGSDFYAGDGTADYPYMIKDKRAGNSARDQIGLLFGDIQDGYDKGNTELYKDCHFVLGQDVDMAKRSYTGLASFSGSFDGNGNTLWDFTITPTGNVNVGQTGLFGNLTGTVRNLQVRNASLTRELWATSDGGYQDISERSGNRGVGILAGNVEKGGRVEYCQVIECSVSLTCRDDKQKYTYHRDWRNLIAGGAVGYVGDGGSLDTVMVLNTSVKAIAAADRFSEEDRLVKGLTGMGQAFVGGLTGALHENGSITRCSYNQSEKFKNGELEVGKLYAESRNFAVAGGLIGWSGAKSVDQTAYNWLLLADSPMVTGEDHDTGWGIGHCANDDVFPLFVYKLWGTEPNDIFQSSLSVQVITEYYSKYGMDTGLDLTPYRETNDTDVLFLYYRDPNGGIMTPPNQLNYTVGDYLNLSGYRVYQTVGRCKLDTELRYTLPCVKSDKPWQVFYLNTPLEKTVNEIIFYNPDGSTAVGSITTGAALSVKESVHAYVTQTTKAATCTEDGEQELLCLLCGDKKGPETVEALGHHTAVTKHGHAATCTEDGLTDEETCVTCGKVITEQTVIPAAGHHTETRTILEPSCVSGGVKQETCTVCGELIRLENLKPLGHDYQAAVTGPTCETPGYTTHTCTRCGNSYTDSYTAPTDHHYGVGAVTREPTCTEPGEMTYTCTCGDTHTEPIPTIDHDYAPVVTAPTCTEMGCTTHTCTVCGASFRDSYTAPVGHSWDEGVTVTPPTLIADGLLRQTCTVCGGQQDTAIPSLTSCDGSMDCPSRKFNDVADIHDWSHIGIDYTLRCSLFYGTSSTTFSPNAPMTRAMLVTVLYRMEGRPSVEGQSHSFEDVPEQAWYEDALIWAGSNGIINGVSDTIFDPDSNVTRQQVAVILYRYAAMCGYDTSASTDLSAFPDSGAVAKYAGAAMSWANATGLLQGNTDGETMQLLPEDSASRAQLAAILMRFMKTIAK